MELGARFSPGTYMLLAPVAAPSLVTSHFSLGVVLLITLHIGGSGAPSKLSALAKITWVAPFSTVIVLDLVSLPKALDTVQFTVVTPGLVNRIETVAAEALLITAPLLADQA